MASVDTVRTRLSGVLGGCGTPQVLVANSPTHLSSNNPLLISIVVANTFFIAREFHLPTPHPELQLVPTPLPISPWVLLLNMPHREDPVFRTVSIENPCPNPSSSRQDLPFILSRSCQRSLPSAGASQG